MTVVDHASLHARMRPGRLALAELATGRRWTYRDLDEAVARCATVLRTAHGIGIGDRVASLARNRAELALLHLACARIGAVYVPLNWRLAPAEVAELIRDAEPRVLVGDPDLTAGLADVARVDIADLPASMDAAEPLAAASIDRSRPSLILYTSGTSGHPKGVVLTEANLDQTAINFSVLAAVSATSVFLSDSPMFHVIGLVTSVRAPLLMGGALLLSDGFEPARTLARMGDPALGVTHYFCVPQMAARLIDDPSYDAASLAGRVTLYTGGAPHARAAILRWVDDGIAIADGFGMSETGTVFCMPADLAALRAKAGSVGVPTPGVQARIVDGDAPCADGTPGDLEVRGANVTAGYWRRPAETAAAFTADGWLRTGDVAVRDADGFHTIVDRKKDMFISGGENVYPAEIEAALSGFPGLLEAAVCGVPDARWGEVGHCVLVAAEDTVIDPATVRAHLERRIARYKVPRHITLMDALPRTSSGKIRRAALRALVSPPE